VTGPAIPRLHKVRGAGRFRASEAVVTIVDGRFSDDLLGRFGVTTEVLSFDSSAPRRLIALSTRLSGTRITTWAVTFPKLNFLDDLKAVTERAEFDPDNFWLDKFTATFCTWHLRKASIFGLCNHGWGTPILNQPCVI